LEDIKYFSIYVAALNLTHVISLSLTLSLSLSPSRYLSLSPSRYLSLSLSLVFLSTQLEISPGVSLLFENNEATESGGAIYVEFPPIRFVVDIFNRLCFLQYRDDSGMDVPPQDWKVRGCHNG